MEVVDYHHTEENIKALESHRPFKRFDVFFSMENHWLSGHDDLPSSGAPYGILESYDGTVLAVMNINCGYGGVGPHQTAALLEWLGVDKNTAETWMLYPGIHIEFAKDGTWDPSSLELTSAFSTREQDNPQVLLGEEIFSKEDMRSLCFINPQYGNYQYLYNALKLCKPLEFTYYCGDHSQDHISYSEIFQFRFLRDKTLKELINGGFVRIHGTQYDVVCFSDRASIYSLLQNLYCFYFGKGLFYECGIGNFIVFTDTPIDKTFKSKIGLIKDILLHSTPKERYASALIPAELTKPSSKQVN